MSDIRGRQTVEKYIAKNIGVGEQHSEAHKQTEQQLAFQTSASSLTFLLPSVTVRGTGMGGHLLRLGGGFSLFQRMMICRSKEPSEGLDW